MELRLRQELLESNILSQYASFSANSCGRLCPEEKCDIRTCYQRDRDRIIHSKSFRRLKHKTQVFISPQGDHYRTRLTHTLEVSQIARTISRALSLNEDLTEAIALGHDLGHTPFGHIGENVLNNLCVDGFAHNVQSLRVVELLEKNGAGLNLTFEVRDGILNHRGSGHPNTLEGKVVQLSDKIAYVNHDIDDAIRAGALDPSDLPADCIEILGKSTSKRINTMIRSVIEPRLTTDNIYMVEDVKRAMYSLRSFLFENVYNDTGRLAEIKKYENVISSLFNFYYDNSSILSQEFYGTPDNTTERTVCDYIAGMTDGYAINKYRDIFLPKRR